MAGTKRRSFLFALFVLLMLLICVGGVALLIYGATNNGIPAPKLPGSSPRFAWYPHG